MSLVRVRIAVPTLALLYAPAGFAMPGIGAHADPIVPVILGVTGVLFFVVLRRFTARKLGQPSVLGELLNCPSAWTYSLPPRWVPQHRHFSQGIAGSERDPFPRSPCDPECSGAG